MIDEPHTPRELEPIEGLLARGWRAMPSAAFRCRVLDAVRGELTRQRRQVRRRFAAAFAAVILLNLCLSLATVRAAGFALQQVESGASVRQTAQRIQRASPELSYDEALLQAKLIEIGLPDDPRCCTVRSRIP